MRIPNTITALLFASSLAAAVPGATPSATPTPPSSQARKLGEPPELPKPAAEEPTGPQRGFRFRNLGPAAGGGRITSIAGIPGNPNVIYLGSASGGVFKTIDGGISWKPIFEKEPSSIGAIAIAPGNPDVVWVGTGEANPRNNVMDGRGVYVSPDGGASWRFAGLADAGQISRVIVNPSNPMDVFVAAVGHAWAPNAQRGVFHTTDGGRTWSRVLYVNDSTGAADLEAEPGNPMVLFAAMWQVRRYPWELADGGEGSGLYRSTDGGATWKRLSEGLPDGPLGRMAVALAPSKPTHVYALVEAKKGLLWSSDDLGDHWTAVSDNHQLDVRPFYFSRMLVSPADDARVYFLSFQLAESDDGGKTVKRTDKGVHPDHHALWIDPKDPDRMIQGNDGGVYLTTNGGTSWRYLDNLPIEQFYMVGVGSEAPYTLCGGLQDNNAWCGTSNSLNPSGINASDWFVVTGGDGEYAMPAPSDPRIVYADSQNGVLTHFDRATHLSRFVRPYLHGVEDQPPDRLRYRFNWTSPIAVSPVNANEVYLGANVLFRTTDAGGHWTVISPDLTRNDKTRQRMSGGPIEYDLSGAETYDTILSISLAPSDPNVIWVGTDDGLVQVTRDGGRTWTNVTAGIANAPAWARVYQVGLSPFDAGTAYVAFDAHMLDDRRAYVYCTHDFGHSWQSIAGGLPAAPVFVVREDPNQRGLLVAGTDIGLFTSPDGGATWRPLKGGNFPTVPVFDVQFVKPSHDLVVATHGRGLFVLDDIRPIEQMSAQAVSAPVHVFEAAPGTIRHFWSATGFTRAAYSSPNPPDGVVVDYLLPGKIETTPEQRDRHETPVRITVSDARGAPVATFFGPAEAGVNRAVWNMRYDAPLRLTFEPPPPESDFIRMEGPRVVPGTYTVTVAASGQAVKIPATVAYDPAQTFDPAELRAQTEAALQVRDDLNALNEMLNRVSAMQKEIRIFEDTVRDEKDGNAAHYQPAADRARALQEKLTSMRNAVYDPAVQHQVIEDDIHYLAGLHGQLEGLYQGFNFMFGQAPNDVMREEMTDLHGKVVRQMSAFNQMLQTDVAAYNQVAFQNGAPTLFAGQPIVLKTVATGDHGERN
jgi:photosystem II stability/assembly factor-like uncharacterized protein